MLLLSTDLLEHDFIVELVDSICRDSVDTQYMIIQNISPNLNSKLIDVYNNLQVFHDHQDPWWYGKASRKYQISKMAKMLFFRWASSKCVNFSRWFTYKIATFFWSCTQPHHFSQLQKLTQKLWLSVWDVLEIP